MGHFGLKRTSVLTARARLLYDLGARRTTRNRVGTHRFRMHRSQEVRIVSGAMWTAAADAGDNTPSAFVSRAVHTICRSWNYFRLRGNAMSTAVTPDLTDISNV